MDSNRTFSGFLISFVFGCFLFMLFFWVLSADFKSSSYDIITNLWTLAFLTLLIPAGQYLIYRAYRKKDKAFAKGILISMAVETGLISFIILTLLGI